MKKVLFIFIFIFKYIIIFSQPGALDNSFNPGTGVDGQVYKMLVQPDGKILIIGGFTSYNGTTQNNISRLNVDGSLDNTFNSGIGANSSISDFILQSDGKIIIAGAFTSYNSVARNKIARLNSDGSLDSAFILGNGTAINIDSGGIESIAIRPDNKIMIGGSFTTNLTGFNPTDRLARLNSDGSFDLSFQSGSGPNSSVESIIIQPDGKILLGGDFTSYRNLSRKGICRINDDGSIDGTFNPGTGISGGSFKNINLLTDGSIFIYGAFTSYDGTAKNCIAKLNSNGSLDINFDTVINTSYNAHKGIYSIYVLPNDKIIVGGSWFYFPSQSGLGHPNIARLNSDGSFDSSFDFGSGINKTMNSTNPWNHINYITLQNDGKILIGGNFTQYRNSQINDIARIFNDNSFMNVEETENKNELTIYPNPVKNFLKIETKSKLENGAIFSTSGQKIKTFSSKEVNVSDIPTGTYILKFKIDNEIVTQKFIKE